MIGSVFDTNIVVSANLNEEGIEAAIIALALNGKIRLYVSDAILAEYGNVLRRSKFAFEPERIERFLAVLRAASTIISDMPVVTASPHEEDNRFLECAEAAQADFLITGNKRHFPAEWKGTRIVNAREFFHLIDLETDEPTENT